MVALFWCPHAQVHHQTPLCGDALSTADDPAVYSVTVMFRTSLFPKARARLSNTTASPQEFFKCIAEAFRVSLAELQWRMPTLDECLAVQEATPGAEPGEIEQSLADSQEVERHST